MSKEWYAIISYRTEFYGWDKLLSEKIVAETKKEARKILEDELQRELPMRIKSEDVTADSLLLKLYEMKEGEYLEVHRLFETITCKRKECGNQFRKVDSYNLGLHHTTDFCSYDCVDIYRAENYNPSENGFNTSIPVIYMITQISTGKVYIGKTIRSFTLRWWEHLKVKDGNKFHTVLQQTDITDWTFQIIEHFTEEANILERETFWINHYNSIEDGFNSVVSKKEEEPIIQTSLFEEKK